MTRRGRTIAMTPKPSLGYDPLPDILAGRKRHTLRLRPVVGLREVRVRRNRTGIWLRFTHCEPLSRKQYLRDELAQADGLPTAAALAEALAQFYGEPPEQMYLCHFEVTMRQPTLTEE